MVRLSVETINDAYQYINAVQQRELSMRNLQIPAIENLGVTKVRFENVFGNVKGFLGARQPPLSLSQELQQSRSLFISCVYFTDICKIEGETIAIFLKTETKIADIFP